MKKYSIIALFTGIAAMGFAAFQSVSALAPLVGLPLLLCFSRAHRFWIGVPLVGVGLFLSYCFALRGILPGALFTAIVAAHYAIPLTLPFATDRLFGARSTLVFPAAYVVAELLQLHLGPYQTWASLAHTQHANLALMQIVSVTGIWGLTFLVAWVAPCVLMRSWRPIAVTAAVVLACGAARLALFETSAERVEITALTPLDAPQSAILRAAKDIAAADDAERVKRRGEFAERMEDMLARTEKAAGAGAKFVLWSEYAGFLLEEDLPALRARLSRIASEQKTDVMATVVAFRKSKEYPYARNMIVHAAPNAKVQEYEKRRPVRWLEDWSIAWSRNAPLIAPAGSATVGAIICNDIFGPEAPRLAAQAGASLLVDPSGDWDPIYVASAQMVPFRSLETGLPILRNAHGGTHVVTDAVGRIVQTADGRPGGGRIFEAKVPNGAIWTPYRAVGDVFAYLCALGLAAAAIAAFRSAKER